MRINNNMSAVITNNQLLATEDSLSDVMEKLSSGFAINHASDNPSGIAIAGKMQAQIDGLDQASKNGDDGISVLQTAEGALQEVTDMIQRMRELSVQAANGTNADSEKASIQMEIQSLLQEIDRISETTEFNTINLLDGSLDTRSYADHCTRIQTSNTVAAGTYSLTIDKAATTANITSTSATLPSGTSTKETKETLIDTDTAKKTVTTDLEYNLGDGSATNIVDFIDGQSYTNTVTTDYKKLVGGDWQIQDVDDPDPETGSGLAMSGTITINGYEMTFYQGQSGESVYESLRIAAEYGSAKISDPDELLSIYSSKYGSDATLEITFSSVEFARCLGFASPEDSSDSVLKTSTDSDGVTTTYVNAVGEDAEVTLDIDDGTGSTDSMFGKQATTAYDGNHFTITDVDGFEISFMAEAGYANGVTHTLADGTTETYDGKIAIDVTDIGSMTLQVGANEGQTMEVRIKSVSTQYMYIDDVDVTKMDGPEDAMDKLSDALDYVTSVRSQLGAYENRLDHTTSSLDETSENMSSAISRIEDADMATTMVEYTRLNVLAQSATSALSQANELPQLALQLLQ